MSDFSLRGIIALDTAQLKSGLRNSTNEVKRFSSETGGLVKSLNNDFLNLSSAVSKFGLGIAGLLSVGKVFSFIKDTVGKFSEVRKFSLITGSNIEDIMALKKLFDDFRVDFEGFQNYLLRFLNNLSTAFKQPTSDAALMLKYLGLNIEEFKNKSPAQQFVLFADAISKVRDETTKLNIIYEFFGRSAAPVIELINNYGTEFINKFDNLQQEYKYSAKKMVETSDYLAVNLHRVFSRVKYYLSEFAYMFAIEPASDLLKAIKRGFVKEPKTEPGLIYGRKGYDAYILKQLELEKSKQEEREKFINDVLKAKEKEEEQKKILELQKEYEKDLAKLEELKKELADKKLTIEERLNNILREQERIYQDIEGRKEKGQLSVTDELTLQKNLVNLEIQRYKLIDELESKATKRTFKLSPEKSSGIISLGGFPDINILIGRLYASDFQIKNINSNLIKANVLLDRIYTTLKNNAIIIR